MVELQEAIFKIAGGRFKHPRELYARLIESFEDIERSPLPEEIEEGKVVAKPDRKYRKWGLIADPETLFYEAYSKAAREMEPWQLEEWLNKNTIADPARIAKAQDELFTLYKNLQAKGVITKDHL